MKRSQKKFILFIVASVFMHLSMLTFTFNLSNPIEEALDNGPIPQLNIKSIKTVGIKNGHKDRIIFKEQRPTRPKTSSHKLTLDDLTENTYALKNSPLQSQATKKNNLSLAKKILKVDNKEIKKIMKSDNRLSSDLIRKFNQSDIDVQFELPKGVKLDELNDFELRFYSFRMRTAMKYITSFHQHLNQFEMQNPHLKFPLTKTSEQLTGRITYDEKGNIVRIKMVKWTDKKKLQEFFLEVMKKLDSVPNPPSEIVKHGEFSIYYTLIINS